MGIGGSIIFSTLKGKSDRTSKNENEYFTTAFIGSVILSLIVWILIVFFDEEMFIFFGAKATLLELAKTYIIPIKFVLPCFLFTQMLAAFLYETK